MKIILDLQAIQSSESRNRGIGRYSLALAKSMVRQASNHELYLMLNHVFPNTLNDVRQDFEGIIESDHILIWESLRDVAEINPHNHWRIKAAELMRERFLQSLSPDIVHVSSLFEGLVDNATTSVKCFDQESPTAVTLYDLIPFLNQDQYLTNHDVRRWYLRKLASLKRADLLLAISEAARQEALNALGLPDERIVTISTDADPHFRIITVSEPDTQALYQRYQLTRDFVMYTGGIDYRKNIEALIEAFALLPDTVRNSYQLVIVCKISDDDRRRLEKLGQRMGLKGDEVVFTGYVSDDDLVALYNLCKLFVFPSLHEGFGLPVLEAMRCGAPVIGSDCSSIPEVIGLQDALFDPTSIQSIVKKLQQALIDDGFRQRLQEHSRRQSKKFSWDASAMCALEAFEALHERKQHEQRTQVLFSGHKPRLAYISPLPPERSGIADYSAELLPELANYYEIDLITDLDEVTDSYLATNFRRRSIYEFEQHADEYHRILYHFGNSPFHSHMFPLLEKYPGTVVLHDFFLGHIVHHLETTTADSTFFRQQLYYAHSYSALQLLKEEGVEKAVWRYPCNKKILDQAQGVIVHSCYAADLIKTWYGQESSYNLVQAPLGRRMPIQSNQIAVRKRLAIPGNAFMVCSFGILGESKLNDRLLVAWLSSILAKDENCLLVFVGGGGDSSYESTLRQTIARSEYSDRVRITGYINAEDFQDYLRATDVGVQLRSFSRGETSISVLDCMSHALPTIVNAHGSFSELPDDVVYKLPDHFSDDGLTIALETLYSGEQYRNTLGKSAGDYVRKYHSPAQSAREYAEAIEEFAAHHPIAKRKQLISKISQIEYSQPSEADLAQAALAISENEHLPHARQLLIDISVLVQHDAKSGIQRVVRSVLDSLLKTTIKGFRVEPVYRSNGQYHYARRFTCKYLRLDDCGLEDAPIEVGIHDIFIGLDLDAGCDEKARQFLRNHAQRGLQIFFVVYDLLPVLKRDYFASELYPVFKEWYDQITYIAHGLVCISRAVADELKDWLDQQQPKRVWPLKIGYFHLGADISASQPTTGIAKEEQRILSSLQEKITFLTVGTVEPRKGHAQVLDAMERLWEQGGDVSLVIVGKQGWKVEQLLERFRQHPENGEHLIWFENASDELLLKLYDTSTAVVMASEGEGFGLPLIEAAQHGLPIIARDLPVFREVAGEHAFYFSANSGEELASALSSWLELYRSGKHPTSKGMEWLTWEQSSQQLLDVILNDNIWYREWEPGHAIIQSPVSEFLHTQVGELQGDKIVTTGCEGFLSDGPWQALKAGDYRLGIDGRMMVPERGEARIEIVRNKGEDIVWQSTIKTTDTESPMIEAEINLPEDIEDLELRIWVSAEVEAEIKGYQIEPINKKDEKAA